MSTDETSIDVSIGTGGDAGGELGDSLSGVPFLTRWIMWAAVRWASFATRPGGRKEFWRDAPVMVLITLPTLAVLLPAVIVVTVRLLVVHVLEWLFYLPLRLNQVLRVKSNKPAKQVNQPELGWRL